MSLRTSGIGARLARRLGAGCAAAAAALWCGAAAAQELCANPTAVCGQRISAECLSGLGAGVLAAEGAGSAARGGCDAQLEAYKGCLTQAAGCGGGPALDLTEAPAFEPFMTLSCYNPLARDLMCKGADHLLAAMVTSGDETDVRVFATMRGGVYALGPGGAGAPRLLADLDGKINSFASFMQNVEIALPEEPETAGLCITFQPGGAGARWGVAQAMRFEPQTPAQVARTTGQQLYRSSPASPKLVFDAAAASCEDQLAALAREHLR